MFTGYNYTMANKDTYPRRVMELQDKLNELNGDETISAAQSRQLTRKIGESILDLWDFMLATLPTIEDNQKRIDKLEKDSEIGKAEKEKFVNWTWIRDNIVQPIFMVAIGVIITLLLK